jgi:glyoxylase I family protein
VTLDRRTLILGGAAVGTLGTSDAAAPEPPHTATKDKQQRVLGIGGLFFRSRGPKALAEWYQRNLGIDPTPTDDNQPVWHQAAGPTVFAPFPADTKYFGSPQQAWMVNFRVANLDVMAAQLRASGIAVDIDTQAYPHGRFARLHDPDGNPIELWEPAGRGT